MSYRDNGEAIIQMNDALQQDKENLLREVEELTKEKAKLVRQNSMLAKLALIPPHKEIHHYGLPPRHYVIASVMAVIGIISLMIGWVGLLTVP